MHISYAICDIMCDIIQCDDVILAYSNDVEIRYSATSGGIGSVLVHRMFERGIINSAISYEYNNKSLKYIPRIITSSKEYTVSGSIYHEISLYAYIREHINEIKSPFLCFALPCQVNPIKKLLDDNGIISYIIELTCSSQQSFEATEYMLKRVGVKKSDVSFLRYRGEGWPGGIRIELNNGTCVKVPNNDSVWTKIFHSHLFIMPRCFFCQPVRKTASDIKLADPWGIDFIGKETKGRSLCHVKSNNMAEILNEMFNDGLIVYENREKSDFLYSQRGIIARKKYNLRHPQITKWVKAILSNGLYRKIILSSTFFFRVHCYIYTHGYRYLYKMERK